MTFDKNTSITWGDLDDKILRNLFSKWVVQVIRRCFFTFLPVFIIIGGSFLSITIWYFEGIRSDVKDMMTSQTQFLRFQTRQEIEIRSLYHRIEGVDQQLVRLQENFYERNK